MFTWGKGFLNAYSTTVDGALALMKSVFLLLVTYAYLENFKKQLKSRCKSVHMSNQGTLLNLKGVEAYNDGKFHKINWNNGTLNLQNNTSYIGIHCYQAELSCSLTNILNFSGSNDASSKQM